MSKYQERICLGLCGMCGKTNANGKKNCEACCEKSRIRASNQRSQCREQGTCLICGQLKTNAGIRCNACERKRHFRKMEKNPIKYTLQQTAGHWLGDISRWEELKILFDKQKGICKYSGLPITIKGTASLDHIIPRSHGGSADIENLQWIHYLINKMKSNLPEDVFLYLCQTIAKAIPEIEMPDYLKEDNHLLWKNIKAPKI